MQCQPFAIQFPGHGYMMDHLITEPSSDLLATWVTEVLGYIHVYLCVCVCVCVMYIIISVYVCVYSVVSCKYTYYAFTIIIC